RHTRWPRDWSSDVCSSDLINCMLCYAACPEFRARPEDGTGGIAEHAVDAQALLPVRVDILRILGVLLRQVAPIFPHDVRSDRGRSEERRVGKDGRAGRTTD